MLSEAPDVLLGQDFLKIAKIEISYADDVALYDDVVYICTLCLHLSHTRRDKN